MPAEVDTHISPDGDVSVLFLPAPYASPEILFQANLEISFIPPSIKTHPHVICQRPILEIVLADPTSVLPYIVFIGSYKLFEASRGHCFHSGEAGSQQTRSVLCRTRARAANDALWEAVPVRRVGVGGG